MAESNSVSLGPNDKLIGRLYIEGDLHVSGTVEGQLEATGAVEIGEGGNVKASVSGRGVSINGAVEGAVTANDKLVLGRSASLTGDVRVARLEIKDGAKFSGNVQMGKAQPEKPAVTEPVSLDETSVVAQPGDGEGEKSKAKKR